MNTVDTVIRIEREIASLEKGHAKAQAANDAVIQAEANRKYFDPDKQAAAVDALKVKKDAVMLAYEKMRERKAVELATARAELSALQVKQNAEQETQAEKKKADALRAFIAVGGLPQDFDAHYQAVLVARTVKKMDEEKKRISYAGF